MPPCRYEDGDEEEVELHELERILVPAADGFSKGAGGKSSGTAAKGGGSKRNDTAATGGGRAQRGGNPAGKGEGRKRKKAAESPAPSGGAEQPAEEEEDAEQAAAAVQHAMQQDGEEQQQATEPLLKEEQEGEAELHAWLGNAAKPPAGRAPLASPSSERGLMAQLHGIADEVATRSKELVRACDGQAGVCAAAQVWRRLGGQPGRVAAGCALCIDIRRIDICHMLRTCSSHWHSACTFSPADASPWWPPCRSWT